MRYRGIEKKKMDKKTVVELFFVVFSILVISYFILAIAISSSPDEEGLASLSPGVTLKDTPILVVSLESSDYQTKEGKCFIAVNGTVTNIGDEAAEDITVRCRPCIYPVVDIEIQASKKLEDLNGSESTFFELEREIECGSKLRFDCVAECENC